MNSLSSAAGALLGVSFLMIFPNGASASSATTPSELGRSCKLAHVDAQMTREVQPSLPEIARLEETYGVSTIRVDLDANGNVRGATVYHSSGNGAIDREAISAAQQSTFSPEQTNCVASAGSYLVTYEFVR